MSLLTLFSSATSTAGNGTWTSWGEGEFASRTVYVLGTLGGATVTIEARIGSTADVGAGVGAAIDGFSSTAPFVKNLSMKAHSLRAVMSTGGSTATSVSVYVA